MPEKIEILVCLSKDNDESTRNAAFRTLQTWNSNELQSVLLDPSTPPEVLDFSANHLAPGHKEIQAALLQNPNLPADLREWVEKLPARPEADEPLTAAPAPASVQAPAEGEEPKDAKRETLLQKISRMSAAEKIKAALTGSQEERLLLIRDSNKIVARAVLQSPKLSDQEIESYASMKNVTEEVLRLIAMNRKYMKSYTVVKALVNNPRAPIDITLPLIYRLNDRDQKALTINKNVPEVLRSMMMKLIKQKEEALKPKIHAGKH